MLQILSGKCFKEEYKIKKFTQKEVLYSNVVLSELINEKNIETEIGTFEMVNLNGLYNATTYLFTLNGKTFVEDNSIDYPSASNQFRILLSFWFKSIFEFEKSTLERQCRESPKNSKDKLIPIKFLPDYFKNDKICKETASFEKFVKKILNLPREKYLAVLNSLNCFVLALNSLEYNIELSYSLLVFAIESLTQKFDEFEESWEYYDENIKSELDCLVEKYQILLGDYVKLQDVILNGNDQKAFRRFKGFSMKYVGNSFFKEEAIGLKRPLRKSELELVLYEIYNIRSGYVHELSNFNKIQKLLFYKGNSEIIYEENNIFLTIGGLTRLAHHILKNFIMQQDEGECTEIDFTEEMENWINMKWAPENWNWDGDLFNPQDIFEYFYGFLILIEKPIDLEFLTSLMQKIESDLKGGINRQYKSPTLAFYYLCNKLYGENGLSCGFIKTINKYKNDFDKILSTLTTETLITKIILSEEIEWDLNDIIEYYNNYCKKKFNKNRLFLTPYFETRILVYVCNKFYENNDNVNYGIWVNNLILELSSNTGCQSYLLKCIADFKNIEIEEYDKLYFYIENKTTP